MLYFLYSLIQDVINFPQSFFPFFWPTGCGWSSFEANKIELSVNDQTFLQYQNINTQLYWLEVLSLAKYETIISEFSD